MAVPGFEFSPMAVLCSAREFSLMAVLCSALACSRVLSRKFLLSFGGGGGGGGEFKYCVYELYIWEEREDFAKGAWRDV